MRIVNPVGVRSEAPPMVRRPTSIAGSSVGILVNERGDATATDFEQDSEIIARRLKSEFSVKEVVRVIKPSAFQPASQGLLGELIGHVDVAINGLGK